MRLVKVGENPYFLLGRVSSVDGYLPVVFPYRGIPQARVIACYASGVLTGNQGPCPCSRCSRLCSVSKCKLLQLGRKGTFDFGSCFLGVGGPSFL